MESKIKVDISIEGTAIDHFSAFSLEQRFNEHQTFQLRFNHDQIEDVNSITLDKSKAFIGKNITVQFGTVDGSENQFTGIITKVEISQSHGFQGDIIISGFSPSILIDRGPDLGSYLNKDLKTILQQATADAPQNDFSFNIKPAYTAPIDYIIQYRESDFEFINRLSAEYHEWFYYDGTKLNFGKPDKLEEVSLVYGRDLHSLQYGMQIAPLNYQKFAYHPQQDEMFNSQPAGASSGSPDVSYAIKASNQVFSKRYSGPLDVRVNSQKEIDTFVNDEHKSLVSDLVNIMGNGDNPKVGLGKVVNISTSMRSGLGFQVQDFGKFLVTAVYHQLDGVGHYQNTFEGISADSEKVPTREVQKPFADMQLATVVDNNDPQGQGRIKVQFKWQCTANDPTEWLRIVAPDAGSSDSVSTNRGFVFIPEKNDQVLVGFEEGNIARPVILGSLFSGKTGTGGGHTNMTKALTTRSGNTIILDDHSGSVNVKDPSGNVVTLNGDGTVTIYAPASLTLVSKDININAGNSININAGPSKSGGGEGVVNVMAKKSVGITVQDEGITATAKQDIILTSVTSGISAMAKTAVTVMSESDSINLIASAQDVNIEAASNANISGISLTQITGGQVQINQG